MAQLICVSQCVRHFIYSVAFTIFQSIGSVGKNNKATLGSEKLGVVFLSLFLLAGGSEKRGFVRNSRSYLAPVGGKPKSGFLLLLGSCCLLGLWMRTAFFPFTVLFCLIIPERKETCLDALSPLHGPVQPSWAVRDFQMIIFLRISWHSLEFCTFRSSSGLNIALLDHSLKWKWLGHPWCACVLCLVHPILYP